MEGCLVLGEPEGVEGGSEAGDEGKPRPSGCYQLGLNFPTQHSEICHQKPYGTAISKNSPARLRVAILYLLTCFPLLSLTGHHLPHAPLG